MILNVSRKRLEWLLVDEKKTMSEYVYIYDLVVFLDNINEFLEKNAGKVDFKISNEIVQYISQKVWDKFEDLNHLILIYHNFDDSISIKMNRNINYTLNTLAHFTRSACPPLMDFLEKEYIIPAREKSKAMGDYTVLNGTEGNSVTATVNSKLVYSDSTTSSDVIRSNYGTITGYSPDWNQTQSQRTNMGDSITIKVPKDMTIDQLCSKAEERKETMFNFDFGSCKDNPNIRMSAYGVAVKNANGNWVAYDAANGNVMDVDILNFEGAQYLFKMPVAISDIAVGDVIVHNRVPMFVTKVDENGKLFAIDICAAEEKCILPVKNMFGFNYATKVVSLLDFNNIGASADKPFGNLLPFMLMGDNNKDMNPFLLLALTSGKMDMSNPFMLMVLAGSNQKSMESMLPLLAAMNLNNKT